MSSRKGPPGSLFGLVTAAGGVWNRETEAQGISEKAPVPDRDGSSPYKLPQLRWDLRQAVEPRGSHRPQQASTCRGCLGLEKGKVKSISEHSRQTFYKRLVVNI